MTASRLLTRLLLPSLALLLVAAPAVGQKAYTAPDGAWIQLDGVVQTVDPDEFLLRYGDAFITVEFDDGDRDADAYVLEAGDRVTVNGRIDDDLYERRTIEAASVYVHKLNTYFYASSMDEEDIGRVTVSTEPVAAARVTVQGIVTAVGTDVFRVDTGRRSLKVHTEALGYDPLDDVGYQQVDIGDAVQVTANLVPGFLEDREVVAQHVVTLGG